MNAGCAGKTEIPWERVPYLSALEVRSRQDAIQIHVYLYLKVEKQRWGNCTFGFKAPVGVNSPSFRKGFSEFWRGRTSWAIDWGWRKGVPSTCYTFNTCLSTCSDAVSSQNLRMEKPRPQWKQRRVNCSPPTYKLPRSVISDRAKQATQALYNDCKLNHHDRMFPGFTVI